MEELREAAFEAIQLWLQDGIVLGDPTWSRLDDDDEKPKSGRSKAGPKKQRPKRQKMLVSA